MSHEAYFTNDAAQCGMKGETQRRHWMPAWARAGLDIPHCIQSHNGYRCNCKAWRIGIWTNSRLGDHSFRNASPQCNERRDERDEMDEKGKNTA